MDITKASMKSRIRNAENISCLLYINLATGILLLERELTAAL
jgi:hypothetical protein